MSAKDSVKCLSIDYSNTITECKIFCTSNKVINYYDAASFDNSTVTSQFGLITKTMARDNANYYHCIGIKKMRPKK